MLATVDAEGVAVVGYLDSVLHGIALSIKQGGGVSNEDVVGFHGFVCFGVGALRRATDETLPMDCQQNKKNLQKR